jgi:regulatory protein
MTGTITAIELQKRDKDRVNVYLDDDFAFSLSALRAASLKRGQYLSDEAIRTLCGQDDREQAHDQALNYLTYRPRSEAELERYLARKGWDEAVVREEIERLKQASLVDDREFARFWVENRQRFRPRGRMALRYEMKTKGLSEEDISESLEAVDEEASAYALALVQVRKKAGLAPRELRQKLGPYLARRGFSYSVVETVLHRIAAEEQSQDEEDRS